MSERFAGLTKIPRQPAARLLAATNLKLESKLETPATAGVPEVLEELEKAGAYIDMLKLMAAVLPPRECAWWACLAARDVIGPDAEPTPALKAAEAWVFRPGDDTRAAAFRATETAEPMDDTAVCATIAVYAGGTLGPDNLDEFPAPDGAVAAMAFGMNVMAVGALADGDVETAANLVLDRGLDIARGGNGRIEKEAKEDA